MKKEEDGWGEGVGVDGVRGMREEGGGVKGGQEEKKGELIFSNFFHISPYCNYRIVFPVHNCASVHLLHV